MRRILVMAGLLLLIHGTSCAQVREMILTISDGNAAETLHFGLMPGATDSIDAGLGEMEVPPPPPAGVFDARFVGAAFGEGMTRDLRRGDTGTVGVRVHELCCQAGEGRAITIGWDLPSDVVVVALDAPTGVLVRMTMRGAGTYTILHPELMPRLRMTVHYKPVCLRIKAFLEGPFHRATSAMSVALRSAGILATRFGAGNVPVAAVDSVAIEIRSASSPTSATVRQYAPAWLLADGTVRCFTDTAASEILFDSAGAGAYYIVFRHRNHLAIMSRVRLALSASLTEHDFTTGQAQAFGMNPMKGLGPDGGPPFGLYAADGNASGAINAADRNAVWRLQNGNISCYLGGDFNLNGVVNATDYVAYWRLNNGVVGHVP